MLEAYNDRFLIMVVPGHSTWIYDQKSGKSTTASGIAPKLNLVIGKKDPLHHTLKEFKSAIINGSDLYMFKTSKRPCIDNKGKDWVPKFKRSSAAIDNKCMVIRNS